MNDFACSAVIGWELSVSIMSSAFLLFSLIKRFEEHTCEGVFEGENLVILMRKLDSDSLSMKMERERYVGSGKLRFSQKLSDLLISSIMLSDQSQI